MSVKFRCGNCRYDTFEETGVFKIGNTVFQGLKCLRCGNPIFIETKSKQFKQILKQLSTESIQKIEKM